MFTGKCPHCSTLVSSVKIETIDIFGELGKIGAGTSYMCGNCSTVLSVSMDLLGMKSDAVAEIVSTLKN
jgi:uncharacterized Fe-S center protein